MKCKKCIFAKDKGFESVECCNPHSDKYGRILFGKCDGCINGKKSTFGVDFLQHVELLRMSEREVI